MTDLISIIVPVYNSVKYIGECVESVLAQTYKNFELILIEDGSTDGSRALCEKMCQKDNRIRLVCKEHRGVSAARNAGMSQAVGEYLFFLDSDDAIEPRLLETLFQILKRTGAVIATEERCQVKPEGISGRRMAGEAETVSLMRYDHLDNDMALKAFLYIDHKLALYGIGGKMFQSNKVRKLRFNETLTNGEDTLFLYQLLVMGADVAALHHAWYYYRMREEGASKIFSPATCRSRYRVERYICDHEIKSGRSESADYWEKAILNTIVNWYKICRCRRDRDLIRYVRHLADHERRLKMFFRVDRIGRMRFYFIIYFYSVYRIAFKLYLCMTGCLQRQKLYQRLKEYREVKREGGDEGK